MGSFIARRWKIVKNTFTFPELIIIPSRPRLLDPHRHLLDRLSHRFNGHFCTPSARRHHQHNYQKQDLHTQKGKSSRRLRTPPRPDLRPNYSREQCSKSTQILQKPWDVVTNPMEIPENEIEFYLWYENLTNEEKIHFLEEVRDFGLIRFTDDPTQVTPSYPPE